MCRGGQAGGFTSQGGLNPPVCGGMPWCGGMHVVYPVSVHCESVNIYGRSPSSAVQVSDKTSHRKLQNMHDQHIQDSHIGGASYV